MLEELLDRWGVAVKAEIESQHPGTVDVLNNLAEVYEREGKYEEAKALYKQVVEIRKKELGLEHADTASSLHNLAMLYEKQGRYKEAEPLYLQALEIRKTALGQNHPGQKLCTNL